MIVRPSGCGLVLIERNNKIHEDAWKIAPRVSHICGRPDVRQIEKKRRVAGRNRAESLRAVFTAAQSDRLIDARVTTLMGESTRPINQQISKYGTYLGGMPQIADSIRIGLSGGAVVFHARQKKAGASQ